MNSCEKFAVQQTFSLLVSEGKADYISDELLTAGVITPDDYQRVWAQITDSDRMRVLLLLLLRLIKVQGVNVFQALRQALIRNCRTDLAETLQKCYEDKVYYQGMNAVAEQSVLNCCQSNHQGFTFGGESAPPGSWEGEGQSGRGSAAEGMDVADSVTPLAQPTNCRPARSESVELSPCPAETHPKAAGSDLLVVQPKDLLQMKDLARKTSGKFYVQGRVFQYELQGHFDNGRLSWVARITDEASGRTEEKRDDCDRAELLENCLLTFTRPKH